MFPVLTACILQVILKSRTPFLECYTRTGNLYANTNYEDCIISPDGYVVVITEFGVLPCIGIRIVLNTFLM